ncbi:MAG: hypothetical protein WAN55_08430 [Halobacteriota archaeon]
MSKIPFWSWAYASRGSDALAGFQKRATGGSSTQFDGLRRGPLVNRYSTKKEKKPGYSLAAASLDSCKQSPPPTSGSPRVLDEFELSAVEPAAWYSPYLTQPLDPVTVLNGSCRTCKYSFIPFYFAEHPVVIAELLVLDAVVVQLVHCAQAVAGQHVDVDDVVAAEHPEEDVVVAAEHPDEDVVVGAAEHPDGVDVTVDDVVGAFAEQPCGTEVVVVVVAIGVAVAVVVAVIVVDDVCATTPTTPTIESATAAATRKTAIFFMLYLSFFS